MKRAISILALVAFAAVACQPSSAEAKGGKSSGGNRAAAPKTTTAVLTKNGTANKANKFGLGSNVEPGYFKKPVYGHGPVNPPKFPVTFGGNPPRQTTPITFGGNPQRGPSHGCGDHNGDCHHGDCYGHDCHRHDCHRCHDCMWWGQICFGDMFGSYNGDCDDCSGDCDFDFCQ